MSKRPSGSSAKRPPRSGSSSAANVVGACSAGSERKSTEPSAATRAAVRPSPIAAYAPIGANPSRRFTAGGVALPAPGVSPVAAVVLAGEGGGGVPAVGGVPGRRAQGDQLV